MGLAGAPAPVARPWAVRGRSVFSLLAGSLRGAAALALVGSSKGEVAGLRCGLCARPVVGVP